MIVGVPKEPISGENRVAATPESVKQLINAGLKVTVHKGAGVAAGYADDAYKEAGATLAPTLNVGSVDVLAHVRPLAPATIKKLKKGAITIGLASPASETAAVTALRDQKVTSFALELVPRISRAQSMDALTSQALVAGYRCVLEAAMRLPRFFPLYMTA
ncbi:MAG: NAD(P)(+) transhydrogenase (Re/Si-specific) subunit alpha, partial [Pontimonas sp.]|nr:NAD(P)(+) transhydrogenase (Re/Si-specific) subunit alpha [Pontimonas sp.]